MFNICESYLKKLFAQKQNVEFPSKIRILANCDNSFVLGYRDFKVLITLWGAGQNNWRT